MRSFWCGFVLCFLQAESREEKAVETRGTLGRSVTFRLRTSQVLTFIFWLKRSEVGSVQVAIVEAGPPCGIKVPLSKFQGRLNVSEDCRILEFSNLDEDDSGTYTAQINEEFETFELKVYKHLLGSDLEVECENNTSNGQNYTLQLNCSAGKWEDGVNYTWTPSSKDGKISSRVVRGQFEDDMNYTCTAENPVSVATKTVSVKQVCEGDSDKDQSRTETVSVVIPVVITVLVMAGAAVIIGCLLWKKKKRAVHSTPAEPPGCPAPDESSKTIYAQIDCLPAETQQRGTKKTQQRKGVKAKDEVNTVYATVNPPKLTPLQTDDEKIQMEGQVTSEKHAHSNLTQPQEADDPSIKTVYDMLSAPRCRDESEFHKLL